MTGPAERRVTRLDSGKFYTGSAVIEDVVHKNNNVQDVVRAEITGKYSGSLTQPVT